jgi:hypothetical protein
MSDIPDRFESAERLASFEQIDREIARLALLCRASILQPGVIERVLHKDASVCGTDNPAAFQKLREMLMLHFGMWQKSARELGSAQASQLEQYAIERLKKSLPDLVAQLSASG